ncbi:pyridoxamine 5'-phosphate oxidase family protein [Lacticaseibacillus zhaodongensis]|uniref:pyridoxamine 5'-phosphate oxidase family protein n=1 Tax=Lacticaseibacillus zhaodongensis TaxID=2668065 RepID=UPI0018AFB03E|nr:pyridoxamine 5'-phosphate oxidase family protein [Lacticaseibacillus zhaodongensis]
MADKTDLEKILTDATQIAVATLTEDGAAPDVRIVLGAYDAQSKQMLFMTNPKSQKVAEIAAHSQAAFAIPQLGKGGFARVRKADVQQINPSQDQVALYSAKYPQNGQYAAHSSFYALSFKEADVTIDGATSTVTLTD